MATKRVSRKGNRKHKQHNKSKHGKRCTRKVTRKHRRHQKRRVHRVLRGGNAQPFQGAKPWNPSTGGNFYPLNRDVTQIPESERFGNIQITPSVYETHRSPDVVVKDLPVPSFAQHAGGRRRRNKATGKRRGSKSGHNKTRRGKKHHYRRRRGMKGGSGGSTVCPSCPGANGVGPASPSFSDFVPQAIKNVYRGAVDTIENTNNAFAGKPPITDDSNISDQPIAHNITSKPPAVNMPPNVGKIMSESRMSVA